MNSIVFGGINSSTYGIYISGEGVWNAPERDAETIQIPGRNGEYVLDKGNFKNIEVTYPAFNQETSYNDFRTKVDNFRNAISSLKGYQRLTDSFHPDEYRMAAFIGGLEVDPVLYNDKAMQVSITFNCKPQRFLTSGETQSNVTSGGTITNPTLFESHPLLLVDGYGDFDINGEEITIQQGAVMGNTTLDFSEVETRSDTSNGANYVLTATATNLSTVALNGNHIVLHGSTPQADIFFNASGMTLSDVSNINIVDGSGGKISLYSMGWGSDSLHIKALMNAGSNFVYGTPNTVTDTATISFTSVVAEGYSANESWTFNYSSYYDGADEFKITISIVKGTGTSPILWPSSTVNVFTVNYNGYVRSTKSALGQLYIDLDIGECYRIENGEYISINTATILPAELPVLKSGANTITYDNTFTSFKITPRWWRV